MIRFEKITQGSFDYQPSDYSYKSSGPTNSYIVSPYDGIVASTYSNRCKSGYILIQHLIQNSTYYSQFCNVGKVIISKNDIVKQGKTIGVVLNPTDEITYTLLNENFRKVNPTIFFNGFKPQSVNKPPTSTSTNNKTTGNQNWVNSFSQSPPKKRKKNDDVDYDENDFKPKKKGKNLGDYSLIDLALSPISLLHKGGEKLGKNLKKAGKGMFDFSIKKKEDDSNLNEDIKRIKKLL